MNAQGVSCYKGHITCVCQALIETLLTFKSAPWSSSPVSSTQSQAGKTGQMEGCQQGAYRPSSPIAAQQPEKVRRWQRAQYITSTPRFSCSLLCISTIILEFSQTYCHHLQSSDRQYKSQRLGAVLVKQHFFCLLWELYSI